MTPFLLIDDISAIPIFIDNIIKITIKVNKVIECMNGTIFAYMFTESLYKKQNGICYKLKQIKLEIFKIN